ncbi:intraflagellar transport protein 43 homolog A-like [Eriocheir sinensis]|uniref:intraflagellar transport protein 43 homolog A-like n=1 Tax=Eriocheir sinensis TaxID=95602 RepID=UPI0021C8CF05|nr:intraflagellar transport protein 43 homolog A-like [Eriocheir sinensis]XP_050721672.1 intraflagellar transport protein 43 homolog A-like [Eriocheir sinensis]XP_050721673.1 intraflagellar transport protein 43 homolog A-like [Eriocheir sinensis]XP_050721674.1 intraflagellar transport protein 43 homolog A-like [Eriocheir sinensis]XP_050721675.1 intraflagellar transport protein 43 homolog A-like [Eriocheir sinensis]XP_050721678.1 intraflagellar transport protein 43 homolog A-like [Eriocheir sin
MDFLEQSVSPGHKKFSPRKGRRSAAGEILGTTDDFGGSGSPLKSALPSPSSGDTPPPSSGPPQGRRRAGGWANSARPGDFGAPQEDKRLLQDSDSDTDLPVIPDLDEVVEEDFTQQIAQAPSVAVNRVATFKELDTDLLRHAAFSTLDDIDLRLLTSCLAPESEVREPDIQWRWDPLFTEVASELRTEWEPKSEDQGGEHPDSVGPGQHI